MTIDGTLLFGGDHAKRTCATGDMRGGAADLAIPDHVNDLVTLHTGALGSLLLVRCAQSGKHAGPTGFIELPHFVLPLAGSYVWHTGQDDIFADANRVLCFAGREEYSVSHPVSGDVSICLMPSSMAISRILGTDQRNALSASRSWPTTFELQLLARQLVHRVFDATPDLEIDENMLLVLELLISGSKLSRREVRVNQRAIRLAKEYVHENPHDKIALSEVAQRVGLNPVYLSQMFAKAEGVPLYRYARSLRLSAALNQLASSKDITSLALDQGFSSHSHFTAVFSKSFHQTPSTVREMYRPRRLRTADTRLMTRSLCEARSGG